MPGKGAVLKLKNMSEKAPFMIYADTEKSYTKKYQKHEIITFSYYIKCFDDTVYKPVL